MRASKLFLNIVASILSMLLVFADASWSQPTSPAKKENSARQTRAQLDINSQLRVAANKTAGGIV
jgi:hypothetical protein